MGDDLLDSQWYFVLAMMLKDASFDKIELVSRARDSVCGDCW